MMSVQWCTEIRVRILFLQQHSLDHRSVLGANGAVQLPGLHRDTESAQAILDNQIRFNDGPIAPWSHTSIPALLFHAAWMNRSWTKPPSSPSLQHKEQKLCPHAWFVHRIVSNASRHDSETENYSLVSVNYSGLQKPRPTASMSINYSETKNILTWYCFRARLLRCQHPPRRPCCRKNVNKIRCGEKKRQRRETTLGSTHSDTVWWDV